MDEITDLPIKPILIKNKEENPLDIDSLSDEELDKILLSSPKDKKINNTIDSQEEKKLNLKHLSTKRKVKSIKDIVKSELLKLKQDELNINKRSHPRDIEKITQQEIERQKKFSPKGIRDHNLRDNETDNIILSKQSTNELLTKAERKKVLVQNQINKQEIQNEICKKRTILKDLQKIIFDKKECDCIDQFLYIAETGTIITRCKKCSRVKEWNNINEWYRYVQQIKKG